LAILDMAALTTRPHLLKVAFNPLTDFTLILQYGLYVGGLCVLSESPIKTIDEFIAYAKDHPGFPSALRDSSVGVTWPWNFCQVQRPDFQACTI
jgi:tripartite-type tricarboxylate transporter receptor subunit TctC